MRIVKKVRERKGIKHFYLPFLSYSYCCYCLVVCIYQQLGGETLRNQSD